MWVISAIWKLKKKETLLGGKEFQSQHTTKIEQWFGFVRKKTSVTSFLVLRKKTKGIVQKVELWKKDVLLTCRVRQFRRVKKLLNHQRSHRKKTLPKTLQLLFQKPFFTVNFSLTKFSKKKTLYFWGSFDHESFWQTPQKKLSERSLESW